MGVDITRQALSLSGAIVLGLGLGLVYDLFRVLRVRLPFPGLGGMLDVLFWACAAVSLFIWSVVSGDGVVRLYIALGMLAGCWVYFQALSHVVLNITYHLADICSYIAHILFFPVRSLLNLLKNIRNFFKNHFQYWKLWYKIDLIFAEDDVRKTRSRPVHKGGNKRENHKGQLHH